MDVEETPKKKKEKKEKREGGSRAQPSQPAVEATNIEKILFRVGKIVEVGRHPDADGLYVEKIDVGEEQPRQILSGLVKFIPIEQMQDRRIIVCCNLKPAKMRGIMSYGMVLCAENDGKTVVEFVEPPEDANIGDRICVEGVEYRCEPEAQLNPKKKVWDKVAEELRVDSEGFATYEGKKLHIAGKYLTAPTVREGVIR
uniref:tRNA-binding domain-containing protein n=1 Tax=Palpitomonas bilix TaxID=652834 RepID=A0A7S3DDP8_9EUKA